MWYTIKAVAERLRKARGGEKNLKKLSKNLLTNGSVCDIIYRLPTREDSAVFAKAKPRKSSLKIEQQSCVQA